MLRRFRDAENDPLQIAEYVIVGETQHAVTAGREPTIASLVVANALFEVVALAIELDDELAGMRDEVRDVIADRSLSAKIETSEADPLSGVATEESPRVS